MAAKWPKTIPIKRSGDIGPTNILAKLEKTLWHRFRDPAANDRRTDLLQKNEVLHIFGITS